MEINKSNFKATVGQRVTIDTESMTFVGKVEEVDANGITVVYSSLEWQLVNGKLVSNAILTNK